MASGVSGGLSSQGRTVQGMSHNRQGTSANDRSLLSSASASRNASTNFGAGSSSMKRTMSLGAFSSLSDGLKRTPSLSDFGQALGQGLKRSPSFHREAKYEQEGGWNSTSQSSLRRAGMERDASMVNLLNVIDPESLVDRKPKPGEIVTHEQHSALSVRGIAFVGSCSALLWYGLRLILRDIVNPGASARRGVVLELHALSTVHALGWICFFTRKWWQGWKDMSQYCSRALVASLGFYIHDIVAIRGTIMHNPGPLVHQVSVAMTIASILRSKGVAWLAPHLMSLAVPTFLQEILLIFGTLGVSTNRPEVRGLRLLWFVSFLCSKMALVPLWVRKHEIPELHQPNMLLGKASHVVTLAMNLNFLVAAARNLPKFVSPKGGIVVPVSTAYRVPIKGAMALGNAVVSATVLGTIFGSYLSLPAAVPLILLSMKFKSVKMLRALAAFVCSILALDQIIPMPRECTPKVRLMYPVFEAVLRTFNFKVLPEKALDDLPKDRHHLFPVSPHGFFPWGLGCLQLQLFLKGYLPTFLGASAIASTPIAGRLLRTLGFRPATRPEIRKTLECAYPRNMSQLVPGGIREMFLIRKDIELSAANVHAGFVELAIEKEAIIVPTYLLGNSQLYQVADGALGQLCQQFSRKFKMSVNLFTGRWGTLLPYPGNLGCAFGEPIDTRIHKDPKVVHKMYCDRLRAAFDEHKADFGWPDRELFFDGEELPAPPEDEYASYSVLPELDKMSKL